MNTSQLHVCDRWVCEVHACAIAGIIPGYAEAGYADLQAISNSNGERYFINTTNGESQCDSPGAS